MRAAASNRAVYTTHQLTCLDAPGSTLPTDTDRDGTGLVAGGALVGLVVGGILGMVAALFGELFQRVFYTHRDPPAAAIAFVVAVLVILGVYPAASYVPTPGLV
jgi:hypothetical protein